MMVFNTRGVFSTGTLTPAPLPRGYPMHTSHKIWLFSSISGVQRRCLLPPSPAQRGKVRKGAFKSIKNNDLFSCFSPPPRPSPASGRGGYTEHLNSCVHRVDAGEGSMGSGVIPRPCWERAKIIVLDHRALYSAREDDANRPRNEVNRSAPYKAPASY